MRRNSLSLTTAALVVILFAALDVSAQTPATKEAYTLYHVVASDAKRAGKELTLVKQLKPFAANLKRYDFKKFDLAGLKELSLTKKPQTITLPKGFGKVELSIAGPGIVKVRLTPTKAKPIGATVPTKKPVVVSSDSLKNKSGQQYILILVKKKPKKS